MCILRGLRIDLGTSICPLTVVRRDGITFASQYVADQICFDLVPLATSAQWQGRKSIWELTL